MNQQVVNDMDPAQASGVGTELKAIGSDIRTFFQGMTDKADAMEDEDKRSQTEAAISRVLRDYEPLMDDEPRRSLVSVWNGTMTSRLAAMTPIRHASDGLQNGMQMILRKRRRLVRNVQIRMIRAPLPPRLL